MERAPELNQLSENERRRSGTPPGRRVPMGRATQPVPAPSPRVRRLVLARDAYSCTLCGTSVIAQPATLHCRGGSPAGSSEAFPGSPVSWITLCGAITIPGSCAERAAQRDPRMNALGYWLRRGQDPEQEPVQLQGGIIVWLTTDGCYRVAPLS